MWLRIRSRSQVLFGWVGSFDYEVVCLKCPHLGRRVLAQERPADSWGSRLRSIESSEGAQKAPDMRNVNTLAPLKVRNMLKKPYY